MSCSRRHFVGACAALAACGKVEPTPVDSLPEAEAEGWWPVSLADYPALEQVGGWALVEIPEALLQLVMAQTAPGVFIALWSICTHGACELGYEHPETLVCPCHGSVFAEDGAVLEGPATEPLRSFPVRRDGDTLRVWRPL